jgi:hypothetical protein
MLRSIAHNIERLGYYDLNGGPRRDVRGQDSERRQTRRSASRAAYEV